MSIAKRSRLSQKETVYHDETVYQGKKQSIMERNSLSQKETVYHRKKQSIMGEGGLSSFIIKTERVK